MQDYKKIYPGLHKDVSRRDFTCNALAWSPNTGIIDFYGGRLDIYAKQIKTVGMPKDRIMEDPLRIFRAARFAARYGFTIDPNFIGKARQLADRVFDVSIERWVQELDKLLTSDFIVMGLGALHEMNVAQRVFPEITRPTLALDPSDNPDEAWKDLLNNIDVPESIKEQTRVRRYILTGICHRFKFSNDRTDFILDKPKKKE